MRKLQMLNNLNLKLELILAWNIPHKKFKIYLRDEIKSRICGHILIRCHFEYLGLKSFFTCCNHSSLLLHDNLLN